MGKVGGWKLEPVGLALAVPGKLPSELTEEKVGTKTLLFARTRALL